MAAPRRVTIVDIAAKAGVSTTAVSYALNGGPGVSPAARAHILQIARELNWVPNAAARMLASHRTDTVGLILSHDPRFLAGEYYFWEFISGLEIAFRQRDQSVLLRFEPEREVELATLRAWHGGGRVDGVILVDLQEDDVRVDLVKSLGMPAVAVGDPSLSGGLATVWTDDAAGARSIVRHLHDNGHRSIARITGSQSVAHVRIRDRGFVEECGVLGLKYLLIPGDFSAPNAAELTRAIIDDAEGGYTAIVFDSAATAIAGLQAALQRGVRVPDDLNIVGWDNSAMCSIADPPISVLSYDVISYGEQVGRVLNSVLAGEPPQAYLHGAPQLTERGTTSRRLA